MVQFQIPEENIPLLQQHVDRINRRHQRHGFPEIKLIDHQRDAKQQMLALLQEQAVIVHNVEIVGDIISLDGQEFVARLDILVGEDGAENVVIEHAETTDSDIERRYRDPVVARACDHCGHNRKRKSVFLLRDKDGRETRVGSTCMQDYNVKGDQFARFTNEIVKLKKVAKEASEGQHLDPRNMAQSIVLEKLIDLVIDKRENQYWAEQPIREVVNQVYYKAYNTGSDPSFSSERAKAVIRWVRESVAHRSDLSDEQHNMVVATKYDLIPQRLVAEAARAVVYHHKAVNPQRQSWELPPRSVEFAGAVGDVINDSVVLREIRRMRSKFGHSWYWLVKFKDDQNRDLVWFAKDADPVVANWAANQPDLRPLQEKNVNGAHMQGGLLRLKITAVVQKQSFYKGQKSTQITQVKEV